MKDRYQTPLPGTWFLQRPGYLKFMLREATAFFILGYLVVLLFWLHGLAAGAEDPARWEALLASGRHPLMIAVHVLALIAALYHTVTWFNLTPKIMVMHIGETRVPDALAAFFTGYFPWLVVSGVIIWAVTR